MMSLSLRANNFSSDERLCWGADFDGEVARPSGLVLSLEGAIEPGVPTDGLGDEVAGGLCWGPERTGFDGPLP